VVHGCQAGLQQETHDEVYFARILKGTQFYSSKKLGAISSNLAAVACFFEIPWERPCQGLSPGIQASLLGEAAFYLRAIGRLSEAIVPIGATVISMAKSKDWINAARAAGNLCEVEQNLGEIERAVTNGNQAVTYADYTGDMFQRQTSLAMLADALHYAGRRAEAQAHFREAEEIRRGASPNSRCFILGQALGIATYY